VSYSLPNTTAAADFGPPFVCPGSRAVQLTVANGAVLVQFGRGIGGAQWSEDSFRIPGVHTIPGPIDAVRVKWAAPPAPGGKAPQYAVEGYV
jgi:hypothetical protein